MSKNPDLTLPEDPRFQGVGITFDDLLILPAESDVLPKDAITSTRLSRRINLNIPILSSAMDTVTEGRLAIALAQEGGMGIIHRNLKPEDQAREVVKVKRSASGVITGPVTLTPEHTIAEAKTLMEHQHISGIPIVEALDSGTNKRPKVVGILTKRDLKFQTNSLVKIGEVMTKTLVTAPQGTGLEQAQSILHKNKVEKLILLDTDGGLAGMITIKDIDKITRFPLACRDTKGRLRAGAAVGTNDDQRAELLAGAGVDVMVVDTAHGHSQRVLQTVSKLKKLYPRIDIVAGNVATADGAQALADAGADAIKVGVGPGSICTTRIISGIGVPQVTAILEGRKGLKNFPDVALISDGGIKFSGDIVKALAAGADCVMIGNLFAGTEESPGDLVIYKGRTFKAYRGMGSLGAMSDGGANRYGQDGASREKLVPEGIEGRVPFKGPMAGFLFQLVGGLRSGMGYLGARTVPEIATRARFIRQSSAGLRESHPHDIQITAEAPNYRSENEND